MRRGLIVLSLLALSGVVTPPDASGQEDRFLGAWALVEWTNVRDGETFYPYGRNPAGQIIYTATGRMTAALMNPPESSGEQPQQFVSYWGSYTVDMGAGTVTHHVEGSSSGGMIGTDQVRFFSFEGEDRIVLSPGGQSELTWVRVTYPTVGSVERLDPRLDAIVPAGATLEVLTDGHEWVEGPVWVPHLQSLLFSDIPNNAVYRWNPESGTTLWLQPAGYTGEMPREGESGSNGLALDTRGRLILAQHGDRRIARLVAPWDAPAADFETLAGEFEGQRFNSPNDVAVRGNGDLYFTDPPYGLEGGNDPQELAFQGVYRRAANGSLELLVDDLTRPNGIAFSPDESTLYVANSDGRNPTVMAYDVRPDGGLANGRVFFDSWGDGMAVDAEGNVYLTGPGGGVLIIAPDGEHLGTLVTGDRTANATFGDDGSTLYVANNHRIVRIRLSVRGAGF